jgi:hypothetical protein
MSTTGGLADMYCISEAPISSKLPALSRKVEVMLSLDEAVLAGGLLTSVPLPVAAPVAAAESNVDIILENCQQSEKYI